MIFSEDNMMLRELARDFANKELTPELLDQVEETNVFPEEVLQKMADIGFFGLKIPEEYGGMGGNNMDYVAVIEEISRVSAVASLYVSAPNGLGGGPLLISGTEEQKQKYLPPLVTNEKKMCFALTEPGAGSDANAIITRAEDMGDYFLLNGRKTFITRAPLCADAVVYAKTKDADGKVGVSAFIVDMHSEGVSTGKHIHKMGLIGAATSDIILEDVKVPKENLLGQINQGFKVAMKTLDGGRLGVAAMSLGVAQSCLDEAIKYTKVRKQFGMLWPTSRTPSLLWPTWPPSCRQPRSWSTPPPKPRTAARTAPLWCPWPSISPPRSATSRPPRPCSSTAATATPRSTALSGSTGTAGCSPSSRAPLRSSRPSSPALC